MMGGRSSLLQGLKNSQGFGKLLDLLVIFTMPFNIKFMLT